MLTDGGITRMLTGNIQFPVVSGRAKDAADFKCTVQSHLIASERRQRCHSISSDLSVVSQIEDPGNTQSSAVSPLPQLPPQRPSPSRQQRPSSANACGAGEVKARPGYCAKPVSPDRVMRRHKDSDLRGEQIFKVPAPIVHSAVQVVAFDKLRPAMRLVVVVTMKHDLKFAGGEPLAQVL